MGIIPLAIYIGLIFLRPMDWVAVLKDLPLVNAAAIMTLLLTFPEIMRDHVMMWRRIPQVRVALWLLLAVPLSFAPVFYMSAMSVVFQEFGKIIVLYLLILLVAREQKNLTFILWVIMICIVLMAVHAILQIHVGQGFGGQRPFWRVHGQVYQAIAFGIFKDPNDLCQLFVIALPLLYGQARGTPNPGVKGISLALMPLVVYGAWLTNSRGGIVGLCGMIGAYTIVRSKGFRRWFLAIVGILMVTVVAPSRFSQKLGVDIGRANAWGDCIGLFKSSPRFMIFGIGYGLERDATEDYMPAHNSCVQVLVELGLLGYVPWFLLIFLTLLYVRRTANLGAQIGRSQQFYLTGYFSALAGYLTSAYFLSRAYNHVLYIILAMGLSQALVSLRTPEHYQQVFGPWKRDLKNGCLLALGSVIGIWITVLIANKLGGR